MDAPRPATRLGLAFIGLGLGLGGFALRAVPRAAVEQFRWSTNDFEDLLLAVGAAQLAASLLLVAMPSSRVARGLTALPALAGLLAALGHHLQGRPQSMRADLGPLGRLVNLAVDVGATRLVAALGLGGAASLLLAAAIVAAGHDGARRPVARSPVLFGGAAILSIALFAVARARGAVTLSPYDLIAGVGLVVELGLLAAARAGRVDPGPALLAALAVVAGSAAALEHALGVATLAGLNLTDAPDLLDRAARDQLVRPRVLGLDALAALGPAALLAWPALRALRPRALLAALAWMAPLLGLAITFESIARADLAAPIAFFSRFSAIDLPAVGAGVDRPLGDLPALRALIADGAGQLRLDDSDGLAPPIPLDPDRFHGPARSPFIAESDARARRRAAEGRPLAVRALVAADRRLPFAPLARALGGLDRPGVEVELGVLAAAVPAPEASGKVGRALALSHARNRTLIRVALLPGPASPPACPRGGSPEEGPGACAPPVAVVAREGELRLAILGAGAGTLRLPRGLAPEPSAARVRLLAPLLPALKGRPLLLAPAPGDDLGAVVLLLDQLGALDRTVPGGKLFARIWLTIDEAGLTARLDAEGPEASAEAMRDRLRAPAP
ncbi:MAG: hypothetical protein U0359_17205 [Byssovorax sp.]